MRRSFSLLRIVMALAVCTAGARAQSIPPPDLQAHPGWPKAAPTDVATPLSTIRSFYDAISGPIGQKRDWTRVRSLFVPGGRIAFVLPPTKTHPAADIQLLNLDEYQQMVDANFVKYGFYDRNVANRMEQFGHMADVYSTYESRSTPDGKPFARGVKSVELLHSGDRWYIVQIYWDDEESGGSLPEKYLHDAP